MNFLLFFFLFYCNQCTVLLVHLITSLGGRLHHTPHFDLGHCGVSKLCNWCVQRQEACKIMLLKEEQMYMLEETVNVGLKARSMSMDESSPQLVEPGRSERQCQLFLMYMHIVFFWKPMETGSKMRERGKKCSQD